MPIIENKNEIFEGLKNLPKDVQDAVMSEDTSKIIQAIGKNNGLNLEQIKALAEEAGALMGGHTHPKDFVKNVKENLGVSEESAKLISKEVNEQIFAKIRESLKKIHGVEEETETPAPTTPTKSAAGDIKPPQPETTNQESRIKNSEAKPSPFEEKLKTGAPPPFDSTQGRSAKQELEQAKEENRYPQDADPYREPTKP